MIPSIGRIVLFRLSEHDAAAINKRREDALTTKLGLASTGVVVHSGNEAREGQLLPMVIVRVWGDVPTETTRVNGQVLLDGNDTLWVTSVDQGDGPRQWRSPTGDAIAAGGPSPRLGDDVYYRSRTGNYMLAAKVTAVHDSLWPEGVDRGNVPDLDSPLHVHLQVFTPGAAGGYQEHNVPFDEDLAAGTWRRRD